MTLFDLLANAMLMSMNKQLGTKYTVDDIAIEKVKKDTFASGAGPFYSEEARCIYDLITFDDPGVRLRGFFRPDTNNQAGKLVLDTISSNNRDSTRTYYTANFRINLMSIGLSPVVLDCPDNLNQPLDKLDIILMEDGTPVLREDGEYIYLTLPEE